MNELPKPDADFVLDCDNIVKLMDSGPLKTKGRKLVDLACKLRKSSDGSNRAVALILNAEKRLREWLYEKDNPTQIRAIRKGKLS